MTFPDVVAAIDQVPASDLPAVAGVLGHALAKVQARIMTGAPTAVEPPRAISMREAAERSGYEEWYLRERGRRGELPTVQHGIRGVRILVSDLDEFVRKFGRRR